MIKLNSQVTDSVNFFQGVSPFELTEKYGTPLYVYNERIFREKINELKNLVSYDNFAVNFSAKANSNLALLQIAKEEGIDVDAMSPGEAHVHLMAGFNPEDILYIGNNVSEDEMNYFIEKGIKVSVDSLSQLEQYGRLNPGGKVVIRFNPGVGAGHHKKVITAGKDTKFGVNPEYIPEVKKLLEKYNLTLIGINQHIGSLFMDETPYIEGSKNLLEIAKNFDTLEFIDIGGGFGIPYRKQEGEKRLALKPLGEKLDEFIHNFVNAYGRKLKFKIEPGRYLTAECGVLLGQVHAVKMNGPSKYIGTDLGFNVLVRPAMYDSHHEVEVYTQRENPSSEKEVVSVVGNICETGDIIADKRELPVMSEKDLVCVLDAGAYGMVMSSNYNNRLRPAEVLIRENGEVRLVRKRDSFDDITRNYLPL